MDEMEGIGGDYLEGVLGVEIHGSNLQIWTILDEDLRGGERTAG